MTITLGRCRWCGAELEQAIKGRDRLYCTTDCAKFFRAAKKEERDD